MTRLGVDNLDPALLKHKVQSGRVGSASAFTIKLSFTLLSSQLAGSEGRREDGEEQS